jgi:predicted RNA polymerase sigma factor
VLPLGDVGPYQVQVAITAVHDEAPAMNATDWPQIPSQMPGNELPPM